MQRLLATHLGKIDGRIGFVRASLGQRTDSIHPWLSILVRFGKTDQAFAVAATIDAVGSRADAYAAIAAAAAKAGLLKDALDAAARLNDPAGQYYAYAAIAAAAAGDRDVATKASRVPSTRPPRLTTPPTSPMRTRRSPRRRPRPGSSRTPSTRPPRSQSGLAPMRTRRSPRRRPRPGSSRTPSTRPPRPTSSSATPMRTRRSPRRRPRPGSSSDALDAAAKITVSARRSDAYAAIAAAAANAGMIEEAVKAEAQISMNHITSRSEAGASIAQALSHQGRFYKGGSIASLASGNTNYETPRRTPPNPAGDNPFCS